MNFDLLASKPRVFQDLEPYEDPPIVYHGFDITKDDAPGLSHFLRYGELRWKPLVNNNIKSLRTKKFEYFGAGFNLLSPLVIDERGIEVSFVSCRFDLRFTPSIIDDFYRLNAIGRTGVSFRNCMVISADCTLTTYIPNLDL